MSFSDQPPSHQWAALKYRGQKFAEVWFKPQGNPFALTFRIPEQSFQVAKLSAQMTLENLLKAVGIEADGVDTWRRSDGSDAELTTVLVPPRDPPYLEIHVQLKSLSPAVAVDGSPDAAFSTSTWEDLENRWKAILTLEAAVDTVRISTESLLAEMESSWKKPLTMEEKTYAPRADVSQWNKAKNRVHNAIPKLKEFIHRAVWAIGSPERKRLEELYESHVQPQVPFPQLDQILKELEGLRKDRQVLAAQGKTIYQECRGICAELQGALRTLQSNAVASARKKKSV